MGHDISYRPIAQFTAQDQNTLQRGSLAVDDGGGGRNAARAFSCTKSSSSLSHHLTEGVGTDCRGLTTRCRPCPAANPVFKFLTILLLAKCCTMYRCSILQITPDRISIHLFLPQQPSVQRRLAPLLLLSSFLFGGLHLISFSPMVSTCRRTGAGGRATCFPALDASSDLIKMHNTGMEPWSSSGSGGHD